MTPFENFIRNVKNYMAIKTLVSLGPESGTEKLPKDSVASIADENETAE
jgi:hypothetical protein